MSEEPHEILEYQEFPEPIYISLKSLDKFYADFKKKIKIEPKYNHYKVIKEKITDHPRYNSITNKFKLDLKARHYIGTINLPSYKTINIKAKVGNDVKFLYMFEYVDPKFAEIFEDISKQITPKVGFLKVLINRFLNLTENLLHSSLFKMYRTVELCSNRIKGKILQFKTLKNPYFLKGKIYCVYDDLSSDVIENQIVKLALYKLRFLADEKQQNRIRQLLIEMNIISLKECRLEEISKIKYNRFNNRYKIIHNYCKMIIGRFSFGYESGNHDWFSMLLNSWDIYEEFLRKILEKYLQKLVSEEIKVGKNIENVRSWDKKKIIPDIIIRKNNDILLIADAKYKLKFKSIDRHQAGNYIRNIKKRANIGEINFKEENRNCVLIYPQNEDYKPYYFTKVERDIGDIQEGTIFAHSIDLTQIDNESYIESWVSTIKDYFKL